jgi:hypothetical protein
MPRSTHCNGGLSRGMVLICFIATRSWFIPALAGAHIVILLIVARLVEARTRSARNEVSTAKRNVVQLIDGECKTGKGFSRICLQSVTYGLKPWRQNSTDELSPEGTAESQSCPNQRCRSTNPVIWTALTFNRLFETGLAPNSPGVCWATLERPCGVSF